MGIILHVQPVVSATAAELLQLPVLTVTVESVLPLSVPAVWSVVVSVSVVFSVAEGGVGSFPRLPSCRLPVGLGTVPLLAAAALVVSTNGLMPVGAVAVPAALVLVSVVLQPVDVCMFIAVGV